MAPPPNSAWLTSDETTYLVSTPSDSNRSAILELVERIYHAESLARKSRARAILRERIYANYPATIAEREAVKVAAKRMSAPADRAPPAEGTTPPEAPPLPSFSLPGLVPGMRVTQSDVPRILEFLKKETLSSRKRWTSDRAVSAVLVDRDGRLITQAWNTNATIRTRHAEKNLCDKLGGGKIPEGATLYLSLKPCRMCAAMIWEAAADPAKLTVIYLENDPGPMAQGTLLDARSAARLRYLGPNHPLFSLELSARAP
jgi:tRNA(Arg) A34 adenosine deaminase TadA